MYRFRVDSFPLPLPQKRKILDTLMKISHALHELFAKGHLKMGNSNNN